MAELDISGFLKASSVADLDWLDVDEKQYRAMDTLPKQNLDIQPDLEALWAHRDESPTTYLVPNVVPVPTFGIKDPHTMGDMSQEHGNLRARAENIRKVARFSLMQSSNLTRFSEGMIKRFGSDLLREHRNVLAEVLQERGLLGDFYIAASDFPNCAKGGDQAEFVRKYASGAKFVLAKKACCGGCSHATPTVTGGTNCGVFHKEVKVEIPFSENLAEEVETSQIARGRDAQASELPPRERIRLAFLAPQKALHSDVYVGPGIDQVAKSTLTAQQAGEQLVLASSLLRKKQAAEQVSLEAQPIVSFLYREMAKGLVTAEVAKSLKLAFDANQLTMTYPHWGHLFKEAGLYGVVYTKQVGFDDCHTGADFLAKHNPGVRAIVAGEKCGSCIYNKTRCLLYGKSLIKNASDVLTNETVEAVLLEHRMAGRLPPWDTKVASVWGDTPSKALRAIHVAVQQVTVREAPARMGLMAGFHGHSSTEDMEPAESPIIKQASRFLNEGLYGRDLLSVLKARFQTRDLVAAQAALRPVLAEQGLQGIYYVDPSAYDDYGRGCDEASRLHRTRLVGYLKQGSKCSSCVHQVRTGFCSKIDKLLVDEPPYANKAAMQREVLASGSSTEVSYGSLVNNATNTLSEFQMQHELAVQVKEAAAPLSVAIQFGTGKVRL
jgi:hypothetical protein